MGSNVRVLILSFYYQPDLSAGSFRTTALVRELRDTLPIGSQLDVVTTMPNRYRSFATETAPMESENGFSVRRLALPSHESDMRGQSLAFCRFASEARKATAGVAYDLVVATSSRLMTAALGATIAKRCGARLYLDIRDIFVDSIKDVLSPPWSSVLGPCLAALESWTMHRATHINLVSAGFRDYFISRYPSVNYSYFTNGIDDEFLAIDSKPSTEAGRLPIEVLYAGNIGEGQGLHSILPRLAVRMRGRVRFKVIGDGGRREVLITALAEAGASDLVNVLPPLTRGKLIDAYLAADVLFLHLNDRSAFEKVLPSKIFEYAALGKPVWAGVAGYAAKFTSSEVANSAVFRPCDAADAERSFARLTMGNVDRSVFRQRYSRHTIMQQMCESILGYLPSK